MQEKARRHLSETAARVIIRNELDGVWRRTVERGPRWRQNGGGTKAQGFGDEVGAPRAAAVKRREQIARADIARI